MICERCKFAKWDLTRNGWLSPSGKGRCTWRKKFRIAGSASGQLGGLGEPIEIRGGVILRKRGQEHPLKCDVFQELSR